MVKRESMTNSNKKDRHGGIFKGERVYPKPKWKGDRMNLFWRGKNMSISYWSLGQSWHDGQKRKKSCQTEGERGENDRAAHWSWRRKRKPGLGLLFMPSKTVLQWLRWPQGRCRGRWWRCLRRGSPWCSWPSCRRGWCGRRSSSRGRGQLQLLQMCWAVSEPLPSQTAANVFLPHQKCLLSSWQGNPTWKLKCIFYDIRSLPGDEEAR